MNVPLNWLSDYVQLPKDTADLTRRLTDIGHMLDKIKKIANETVIDLELRGNRPDLLGLVGIAHEISVIYNTPLKTPNTTSLPPKDPSHPLVQVEAKDLVTRYTALTLKVKIGPSPSWLVKRLEAWETPSINNVVDITNYVMIETGQPLHAFDLDKLAGKRLILRRAKNGEKFSTVQQGQTVSLSHEDLVICDQSQSQCLNLIGGWDSKVTDQTTEILLEAAVYNQANCRKSSRRLKIVTDGSIRHEKLLHPAQVEWALERALYLLKDLCGAEITSKTSDYYPQVLKPVTINFDFSEVSRLGGVDISQDISTNILEQLGFKVSGTKITVPYFRTDIEQPADLVEEILRIYGYDKIPTTPLSGATPTPQTYPSYAIQEKLRGILTQLGLDEVITLSMISNHYADEKSIKLINPPDPDQATLRQNITSSLIGYSQRLTNLNNQRVNIFEIGKVFSKTKGQFTEKLHLGIATNGTVYDLTGILQKMSLLLGTPDLNPEISRIDDVFLAEINIENLTPKTVNPYSIISQYPPIIEDINVNHAEKYANLVSQIKKISPLIRQVQLIDKYQNKLTLRITYHSDTKQLSSKDIEPIRIKLQEWASHLE